MERFRDQAKSWMGTLHETCPWTSCATIQEREGLPNEIPILGPLTFTLWLNVSSTLSRFQFFFFFFFFLKQKRLSQIHSGYIYTSRSDQGACIFIRQYILVLIIGHVVSIVLLQDICPRDTHVWSISSPPLSTPENPFMYTGPVSITATCWPRRRHPYAPINALNLKRKLHLARPSCSPSRHPSQMPQGVLDHFPFSMFQGSVCYDSYLLCSLFRPFACLSRLIFVPC